jgi:hypothetical protein
MTRQLTIEQVEEVYREMNADADRKGRARGVKRDAIGNTIDPKEGSNVATEHMISMGLPYQDMGRWLRPQMARSYARMLAMMAADPAQMDLIAQSMLGAEFLSGIELGLLLARKYPETVEP